MQADRLTKIVFGCLLASSFPVMAENTLDESFLVFLAELENIDNNWTHPVDFEQTSTGNMNDNDIKTKHAAETRYGDNNE